MARKKHAPSEVVDILRQGSGKVTVTELAEVLMAEVGGPREFARKYAAELDAAPAGGMARTKMLDGIMRVVSQATAKNPDDNLDDMTEEQLEAEINRLMSEAADAAAANP